MFKLTDKRPVWYVLILLLLAEALINPAGEFPLNDDWSYSKIIKAYIDSGVFKFAGWQASPLIPQLITGISLTKLFGFSFTTLRIISIVCLFILVIVFDIILNEFRVKPIPRFIILLCLAFNPLALSLGNTFLPDVFTLLLTLAGFLFMVKTLKYFSTGNYTWFILFSIVSTLNRQTGLVLPIVFGIVYFTGESKTSRNAAKGLAPALITITALIVFEYIGAITNNLPGSYHLHTQHIFNSITHPGVDTVKTFFYYFITSAILLGLFILPLTISNYKHHYYQLNDSLWAKIIFAGYFILILLKILFSENNFPFVGNMFYPLGTGPVILTGFNTQELQAASVYSKVFLIALNFIGGISFYAAFVSIISKTKNKEAGFIFPLILLVFFLYLIPICLSYANDRYLLFLLPLLILAYVMSFELRVNKLLFALVFIPMVYFSVAGTHDYLSINRARWKAADHLTKDLHISPRNIDGGFEFNGWHSTNLKNYNPSHTGRWWWIEDDTYIISPVSRSGYETESEFKFSSWMSFEFKTINVLKRIQK